MGSEDESERTTWGRLFFFTDKFVIPLFFLNVHDKIILIQNFNHTASMVKSHRARMRN